tara:strand:+ start:1194 stop:1541 length:348 start_codon:yes stop_codon:yes gene_type:complete
MISTPYFKQLEFLAFKTSKLRSQNNKLFDSLLNNGFSKSESLDITETESFIMPRIAKKKVCSKCKVPKTAQSFYSSLSRCKVCHKEDKRILYKNSLSVRIEKSEANKLYRDNYYD